MNKPNYTYYMPKNVGSSGKVYVPDMSYIIPILAHFPTHRYIHR